MSEGMGKESVSCDCPTYDAVNALREEVERFFETNQFDPLRVTNFYAQARVVLNELDRARTIAENLDEFRHKVVDAYEQCPNLDPLPWSNSQPSRQTGK